LPYLYAIEKIASRSIQACFDTNLVAKFKVLIGLSPIFEPAWTQAAIGIAVACKVHPSL
jgi:hypothetical protein